MLILIGGATRSGKTILATKLLKEHSIPYFCIDYFVSGLQKIPDLGINHDENIISCADKLWPILKPVLKNIAEAEPLYLVDGDRLLPKFVVELKNELEVTGCFLGYAKASPDEKFKSIRAFSGGINNWTADKPDDYVLSVATEGIEASAYLQQECHKFGLQYFDTTDDFTNVIETAYKYIEKEIS